MLAEVSGSMHAYSRVYLRVLPGAVLGARAPAYVFATQLHPVTRALGRGRRQDAITRALNLAPDASGGTRIGGAVKDFLDTDGRRGLAHAGKSSWSYRTAGSAAIRRCLANKWPGCPGWRTGCSGSIPARRQRVSPGGLAAALPHVDTFMSGRSARSVQELLDAVATG